MGTRVSLSQDQSASPPNLPIQPFRNRCADLSETQAIATLPTPQAAINSIHTSYQVYDSSWLEHAAQLRPVFSKRVGGVYAKQLDVRIAVDLSKNTSALTPHTSTTAETLWRYCLQMWLFCNRRPSYPYVGFLFFVLEDEQRLADVEGSSSYGAVASSAVLDSDDQRVDQQDGARTRPGCGMCLYLSVLVSVFLSGLVRGALAAYRRVS